MSAVCRAGHLSDEPDYCSVCGAPILAGSVAAGAPAAAPLAPAGATAPARSGPSPSASCPSCGETREDLDARFCEVCRYDFQERRAGPPPVARVPAARPTPAPAPAPVTPVPAVASAAPAPAAVRLSWELVVSIDPSLDTEPDPGSPLPKERADRVIALDRPDMLVGRHDDTRAIHPEIPLHDPGASRRHAKFVIDPDGAIALQDLASTNGTQVNAVEVPPGTRRRLIDGDAVTLGRWTRITLRSKA